MSWGTEEDVDKIVRLRLKAIRAKHKAAIQKLKDKNEILQLRLDRSLERENALQNSLNALRGRL